MSKVLVIGGLGFIGHKVVKLFHDAGYTISVVDIMTSYGSLSAQETHKLFMSRLDSLKGMVHANYCCDAADQRMIAHVLEIEKPNIVVHLAGYPRQSAVDSDPVSASVSMTAGIVSVLRAISTNHMVDKFVYISSSMVYGDFSNGVDEGTTCNPLGLYGVLKLSGEMIVKDYHRRFGIPYTIIRPSAVYGPWDSADRVITKFIQAAIMNRELDVKGPAELLDFTFVDDAAMGIVKASIAGRVTDNKTYNITRGRARSLLEAAVLVTSYVGKGKIKLLEKNHLFPSRGSLSVLAAQKDFGYNPAIDLEEGLMRQIEWMTEGG